MKKKLLNSMRVLLVAAGLCVGANSAWADPIETVGTDGKGDNWENRKYSTFYNLAQGETFHWNFTVTMYQNEEATPEIKNWNNWVLNVKATEGTATDDWFITLRADNYGWGGCYSNADNMSNFDWDTFVTDMNGGTVDMYVNYSSDDQKVRTYVHTTTSDGTKTYFYYNTSLAITDSPTSLYIALCEQYAKLVINTAEKVTESKPTTTYLYSGKAGSTATYTNAWADTNDFDFSYDVFNTKTNTHTFEVDETYGLKIISNRCSYAKAEKTFSPAANAILDIEAECYLNSNTGKYWGDNAAAYFRFGNVWVLENDQNQQSAWSIAESPLSNYTTFTGFTYRQTTLSATVPHTIKMQINTATNTLVYLKVYNGDTEKLSVTNQSLSNPDYTTLGFGVFTGATSNPQIVLKSITVKQTEQAVTNVGYTVNYQLNGATVKTVTGTSVVDETITALTAINGEEEGYEGIHYLSKSAEALTMVLGADAASNVLNVPVRLPYSATVRLTSNVNGTSSYVDYPFTETDDRACSYAVGWPMYKADGEGNYYQLTGETDYAAMGTFTNGETVSKTVNYTTAASDVVWFYDVNGNTPNNVAYSGGSYTNTNSQLANVKVDAGVYDVIFNIVSKAGSGSDHRNAGVSVNGTNVANLSGNANGLRTLRIDVENDESTITAYGNGASNYTDNLDYVLIKKLPSTISVSITSADAATLVSPYALNFTGIDAVKAYYASAQKGANVTFTRIDGTVAANTPLYVTGTTTSVPVVATGTIVDGNLLVAGTGVAVASEAGGKYNFILNKKEGEDVGFYKAAGQTVAVGKAYLSLQDNPFPTGGAKSLNLIFDGETTGISDITRLNGNGESMNDMPIYNLSGQRIAAPQKGINIVNGKKFIVK